MDFNSYKTVAKLCQHEGLSHQDALKVMRRVFPEDLLSLERCLKAIEQTYNFTYADLRSKACVERAAKLIADIKRGKKI